MSPAARARSALLGWALAYAGLLLVVAAAYGGTLRQSFIADDFANLLYARDSDAPLRRWLSPTFAYSDPVTQARYLPGRVYLFLLLVKGIGIDAGRYHALSLLVHAGNALLVGHLGRTLFPGRGVGAIAALLFATARVGAQTVCWFSCLPSLVSTTCLLGAAALYLGRDRGVAPRIVGPLLLFASLLFRADAAVSVALFAPIWVKDALIDRGRSARMFASLGLAGAGAFAALTWISLRRFPEPKMAIGFAPSRFYAFLADLFAPFGASTAVKVAVVVGVLGAAAMLRDRRVLYAIYGLAVGALFWTVVTYLPLAPRYLYAYAGFSSLLIAALIRRACDTLPGARAAQRAALGAGMILSAWSGWEVRRLDVVWFDYLSSEGAALMRLLDQQRAAGATAPLRVRMTPHPLLIKADLAFFAPTLDVVWSGDAEVVVDTGAEGFVRYYGEDFGRSLWYFPWFVK